MYDKRQQNVTNGIKQYYKKTFWKIIKEHLEGTDMAALKVVSNHFTNIV